MRRCWVVLGILLALAAPAHGQPLFDFSVGPDGWESVGPGQAVRSGKSLSGSESRLVLKMAGQRKGWIHIVRNFTWANADALTFSVQLPGKDKAPVAFICYLKDKGWNWFETQPFFIKPGETKQVKLDLGNESTQWSPQSHVESWDGYAPQNIKELGVKFFWPKPYSGEVFLGSFNLIPHKIEPKVYLYNYRVNSDRVEKFGRFEATFDLPLVFDNPFDPDSVDIEAEFQTPSGKTVAIPAFFYHDYVRTLDQEGERIFPYGKNEWKIRFTPVEAGEYRCRITVNKGNEKYSFSGGSFKVVENKNPGFLNWSVKDRNWLSFDDGTFFRPLGQTFRSPDDERTPYNYGFEVTKGQGTYAFDHYLPRMHENGENYIRTWMSAWWAGIEWNPAYASHYEGLGRYSLENAWRLDYEIDQLNRNEIYAVLTLINHGQFSSRSDAEWWDNPYNSLNGGFLNSPEEFFTSPEAQKYLEKRLRYIVSRWGYSPNIAFWELWNEIDLTSYYDSAKIVDWHKRIVPYLRTLDPWKHPITTHYCRPQSDPMVWVIPELETIVGDAYNQSVVSTIRNFYLTRRPFNKPVGVNEFGSGRNPETLENNLHAGIWSSSVIPMFETALFWWWPFTDNYNLYFHYRALADFMKGEDFRGLGLQISNAALSLLSEKKTPAEVIGMQNQSAGYFWVYDPDIFNSNNPRQTGRKFEGLSLNVREFQPGTYRAEYWDTYQGKILSSRTLDVTGEDTAAFPLPDFEKDIAVKVKKISDAAAKGN